MRMTGAFIVIALLACAAPGRSAAQTLGPRDVLGRATAQKEEPKSSAEAAQIAAAASAASLYLEQAVDPSEYVLGPGDELIVSVVGPDSRTFVAVVLPEGDVFLPEIGAVKADGLTLDAFRASLAETISRHFRNVDLYCYLKTPARLRVFVTGEVEKPGAVEASGVERVTDAIAKAGGATISGSSRLVTVERGGELVGVDLQRFLKMGDFKNNPYLRSGDRIHVPPKGRYATIFGEVKKPGWYEILEHETILDLLDIAGGFTTDALGDSVVLARVQPNGSVRSRTVPAASFGETLVDKDEVGVFSRFKYRKFVYAEGAIQRTGRIYLAENEGLAELLVRAGGFTADADLAAAYVGKRSGGVIQLNLRDYLPPNAAKNLLLDDGDVLAIPRVPKTVTVGGEVNDPGEFEYMGDLTIVQYIGLAGGPTKEGSVNRVVVYSKDGSARNVSRDDLPNRGDVIVVKRGYSRILADVFRGVLSAGTLVVSILILTTNN
ncbi:MAG: hypothetical protein C4574_00405 [Candidatus Latescibacterota bacterium]|nr:MAG: hypothetical protein C4574_00405 [Candidatus Latescibacterota bacterium]